MNEQSQTEKYMEKYMDEQKEKYFYDRLIRYEVSLGDLQSRIYRLEQLIDVSALEKKLEAIKEEAIDKIKAIS